MNGKTSKILIIFVLMLLVISASGCLTNECSNLEKELAKRNLTCHCAPAKIIPKEFENRTDIKPKCFCVCNINGKWENISIVQAVGNGPSTPQVIQNK